MIPQSPNEQRRKYYRSFQYRSVSLDINPHKLSINPKKLLIFDNRKSQTTKNEQRQSNRNLFQSSQKINTFNKTLSQSLSRAKQLQLNSTIISKGNPEEQADTNFGTCTYLQSFEQLMQSEVKKQNQQKRISAKSIKLQSIKKCSKIDRITLPNIIEYQNSQFTTLDPIRLPINSLKEGIQKTRKQLEECPNRLNSIRWEIKSFKEKSIQDVEKFQKQFMKGVDKLWAKLKQNTVYQQTFLLRTKRQIKDLTDFLPPFKKEFQTIHLNQLQLQTDIFQTTPFQLKQNLENENLKQKSQPQIQSQISIRYF